MFPGLINYTFRTIHQYQSRTVSMIGYASHAGLVEHETTSRSGIRIQQTLTSVKGYTRSRIAGRMQHRLWLRRSLLRPTEEGRHYGLQDRGVINTKDNQKIRSSLLWLLTMNWQNHVPDPPGEAMNGGLVVRLPIDWAKRKQKPPYSPYGQVMMLLQVSVVLVEGEDLGGMLALVLIWKVQGWSH